ncbi:translation initiation factor IF-2-like [Zalophus californianus]|uniref:Translation initiation factor IF-2-like n=1 Tax=Zalophus californianus TaxID=9704 RepID=A0A6J2ELG5_ZALCA|nr:translation initiation factor IF-2-like [Zalophus californianus]
MLKEGNEEFALGHYNAEESGDRPRVTEEPRSPRTSSPRGREGAHSQGWKARRPAPAHPRLGLAGHAVIQRRHVRAAAPSLLPPPSPCAWQEKRATWSGNKGPRGPRRSGTRCHPTPGPKHRCSLGPAPRPHAPGPGRSQGGESRPRLDPDTRSRFVTAGKEIPASSFRQSSLPRGALTQAPEDPTGKNCRPTSSAPALSEAASTRLGCQRDPVLRVLPGSSLKRWKNSCLELRWGAGGSGRESAQQKAPRGRGGGERSSGKTSGQSAEAARRGPGHRGFAGTRSLASTAAPKQQAGKLCRAARSSRPPRASRRHCRRRRPLAPHPLARHHVRRRCRRRRRQCLLAASGPNPSANHKRARESSRSRPRPSLAQASPSPSWVPSCSAQLGQGKVIPGREAVFRERLLLFIALSSPSLASQPRFALSDCAGTGFLQPPSPVLLPPRGTIGGDQTWEIRFLDVKFTSRQLPWTGAGRRGP